MRMEELDRKKNYGEFIRRQSRKCSANRKKWSTRRMRMGGSERYKSGSKEVRNSNDWGVKLQKKKGIYTRGDSGGVLSGNYGGIKILWWVANQVLVKEMDEV